MLSNVPFLIFDLMTTASFLLPVTENVEIRYNVNFTKKCHPENGRIAVLFGMSVAQCVRECGLRDQCGALNFWRLSRLCELFLSLEEGVEHRRGCIQIGGTDIEVGQKPCSSCDFGQLCDINRETCVQTECPNKPIPKNGKVLGNANNIGATMKYKCDDGHGKRSGVMTSVCQDSGQWNETADCVRVCGILPTLANGIVTLDKVNGNFVSDTATVSCSAGYTASLDKIMCTESGTWETATCRAIVCGNPPPLENGMIVLDTENAVSYLATATPWCNVGYYRSVTKISCTESGTWDTVACNRLECGDLPIIKHGTATASNPISYYLDTAVVRCEPWFKANSTTITCSSNGEWETATCSDCYYTESWAYAGKKNVTVSGTVCQRWDLQSPRSHSYTDINKFPESTLSDAENYCRNPDRYSGGTWCLTTDLTKHWWELCGIPKC